MIIQWPIRWEAGREYADADLDGGELDSVYIAP